MTTTTPTRRPSSHHRGVLDLVGHTPMVRLDRLLAPRAWSLYAKLEGFNPAGSAKDRAALRTIEDALADGRLAVGGTVVESSSGNMGLALAMVCAWYGLRFICVVDPHTTPTNVQIMKAYGAEVVIVDHEDPTTRSYLPTRLRRVQELLDATPAAFWPNQYENWSGVAAHHDTLAPEIAEQLGRMPDWLFVAVGTCATVQGCATWFHDQGAVTRVVGVDSEGSVVLGGTAAPRKIPGIGSVRQSSFLDPALLAERVLVPEVESARSCRELGRTEAILAGGSAGATLAAVAALAGRFAPDDVVVAVLPDRGSRYLELLFDEEAEGYVG